jgi:hypothetical protein
MTRASKASAGKASATAMVAVGRAAAAQSQQRGNELVEFIRHKMQDIAEGFFDVGEALADLHHNRHYVPMGYSSFEAMVEDLGLLSLTQVKKLIAVAVRVPRPYALRLGAEKAYLWTRYARQVRDGRPLPSIIDEGLVVEGRRVTEASVRDLQRALRTAGVRQGPGGDPGGKPQLRAAKSAQAALRRNGFDKAVVTVQQRAARWWACVEVRLEDLPRIVRRL